MTVFWLAATGVVLLLAGRTLQRRRRRAFIDDYAFHEAIRKHLRQRRPELTAAAEQRVFQGLRQYFRICERAGRRMVAMPSQVVDDAWHGFILFTRAYERFCRRGLGRFLHHVPAEAMQTPTQAQDGIKRAWRLACRDEGIDPKNPSRLPLLFALDSELNLADGFRYQLHCQPGGSGYCASHIGCGGGCGGGDGGGDGDGGCGGGCGGD